MGVHNGVPYFPLKSFGSSFLPGREFATLMTLCLSVCLSFQWSVRVFICFQCVLFCWQRFDVRLKRTSLICFVGLFCRCLSLELMCFDHTYLRCLEV
jgi:hypothetical protein